MKPKSGFKYTLSCKHQPRTFNVFFKSFNNKIVKCWVKDAKYNQIFIGVAKCNTNLDVFDETYGMELALNRALAKRNTHYHNSMKNFIKIHEKNTAGATQALINKFLSRMSKGQLSCNNQISVKEEVLHIGQE